jgi:hypothetical protein
MNRNLKLKAQNPWQSTVIYRLAAAQDTRRR